MSGLIGANVALIHESQNTNRIAITFLFSMAAIEMNEISVLMAHTLLGIFNYQLQVQIKGHGVNFVGFNNFHYPCNFR